MADSQHGAPNTYGFGLEFNYSLWTQGTVLSLVNVPWNNDYRDIVKFDNRAALDSYIDGIENSGIVLNNVSYVKPYEPVRIGLPLNVVNKYNYLRASNPLMPIDGDVQKNYYYFITNASYIAPGTTELTLQLDVWQTFGFDVTILKAYVERGHIGIANSNAFNNYGRDYLTVSEGMDIGTDLQTIRHISQTIMDVYVSLLDPDNPNAPNYMVVSTIDLNADPGTLDAPNLASATGSMVQGIPSGANVYILRNYDDVTRLMYLLSEYPWFAQGIISITMIPNVVNFYPNTAWTASEVEGPFNAVNVVGESSPGIVPDVYYNKQNQKNVTLLSNWRNDTALMNYIPEKYRILKKFFTFPYMALELTNWLGNVIVLKPELWNNADAIIGEAISLFPGSQRLTFFPRKYNSSSPTNDLDDNGEFLDVALVIGNFPTLPIVTNEGILYLAQNARTIQYGLNQADWSQQKALQGNQVSYDQASKSNAAQVGNTLTGTAANTAANLLRSQTNANLGILGAGTSFVGGVLSSAAGSPKGLENAFNPLGNAIANNIQQGMNDQMTVIQNDAAREIAVRNLGVNSYIRDTNKDLADWSAKGDYAQAIAAIQARNKDAQLTAPGLQGQFGGDTHNLAIGKYEISLRFKMLDKASMAIIGDFWLRYGYSINRFIDIPASLKCMTKFTYWKMSETYISTAPMAEGFKQIIRGIFEKGVTVWSSPSYIGTTSLDDNNILEGISY